MQWFKNLKIATQIMSLVMLAIVFLGVAGFIGYYFNQQSGLALQEIYHERILPIVWITEVRTNIRANEALLLAFTVAGDNSTKDNILQEFSRRLKTIDESIASYEQTEINQFEQDSLASLKTKLAELQSSSQLLLNAAKTGNNQAAVTIYNTTVAAQTDNVQDNIRELLNYHVKRAKEVNEQNQKNAAISNMIIGGLSVLSLVICLCFGYWIARAIGNPMSYVTKALGEVAGGKLTICDLEIKAKNEIGNLAGALNTMKNNTANLVRQIQNNAELVAASAEELTASSEQAAQAANQIAVSIMEVAADADEQSVAANGATEVVEQISTSIQQIAANVNQVAAHSSQAADKAKIGDKAVGQAVIQMGQIEETVNASAQVVTKLGQRSKEIGQIVDTISSIAGQTNLLALNAAIEAARAGEQGRGFAVVAEEVRKLAEQSQAAAKKIAELIGEIQRDTDSAVVAMGDGTREVKTGAEVVNTAGSAFREIAELVTEVSDQVKEISAAMQHMASGSQHIVESVKKIDDLSKQSTGNAQSVSAATEEQLASMEEISSSSQALAKLAQDLQEAVNGFRV